jgi:hypothetical protein
MLPRSSLKNEGGEMREQYEELLEPIPLDGQVVEHL